MRRSAFTVLELIVVMAVAAIIAAVAVPRYAAVRDSAAVRAAVADLGAVFALARQNAITRRTPVALVFDTAGGSVEVRSAGVVLARRGIGGVYGAVIGSNRDSVVYDARGLGFGLSNVTVTVRRGAAVDTLTMSRLGRVRW
jgi:prepilin-type N-terminal cleavage/methylation domain-containing protein